MFQIEYFNNKVICDLVEKPRQGIMAVLDDACFGVGNVTDQVSNVNGWTTPSTDNYCSVKSLKFNPRPDYHHSVLLI